jgi:hypothetical protein
MAEFSQQVIDFGAAVCYERAILVVDQRAGGAVSLPRRSQ